MRIREFIVRLADPGDDRPDEYRDFMPSFVHQRELTVQYRVEGDGQWRAYRRPLHDTMPVSESELDYLLRHTFSALKAAEQEASE